MKKILSFLAIFAVAAVAVFAFGDAEAATGGTAMASLTLTSGFRPALLKHLSEVNRDNTPQNKLDPFGFLDFLYSQRKPEVLRLDTPMGAKEQVRVKYLQRLTASHTDTSISCDVTNVMPYQEVNVELSSTRAINVYLGDETVSQYTNDAMQNRTVGTPGTAIMEGLLERVMAASNAILSGVNSDLITTLSGNFGVNRATGSAAAQTINLNQDGSVNSLTDGITKVMTDFKQNRGMGRPQIIGAGLMHAHTLQQAAKSANQSGFNSSIMAAGYDFWYDLDAEVALGTNQFAVVEPNALGIVEYMQFTGHKAGVKPGGSEFGVFSLPMNVNGAITPVLFDFQLKYSDCDQTLTDQYYGTSISVGKGFNLIISKQSGLFSIPAGAFRGTDPLSGNRGTYRYVASNNCESCA